MVQGRTIGSITENWYKWEISVYDLETNIESTDRYFSIKHFNDIHKTNYTADHVQKLKKLRNKLGDYTMDDVRKASIKTPFSVLAKFGHLKFEKIREPVIYETIITRTRKRIN